MACYNEDQLQAFLDGEISYGDRREMEQHIEICDLCRVTVTTLQEDKDFVNGHLDIWGAKVGGARVNARAAWSGFYLSNRQRLESDKENKGGFKLNTHFKKIAASAAAVLFIGLSFTNSSVKAAASDFLTLFRVEKIQTVTINPQQLRSIESAFREKGLSLNIENFGKVTNNGVGEPQSVTLAEAEKLADFELLIPGYMPFESSSALTNFSKSGSIELQLNVKNVNNLLSTLGGTTLLPDELDNQTFSLQVPNAVSQMYRAINEQGNTTARLTVTQFRSPEITAPAGVDADHMREAVLALPVIPDDIRRQLASIEDWQKTMVVPVGEGQAREVKIGDATALYTNPQNTGNNAPFGILAWENQGVITIVEGTLSESELIKVAENLK